MTAARTRRCPPVLRGRGRLYDTIAVLTRVGLAWAFALHALGLRGRGHELAPPDPPVPFNLLTPALPSLLVGVAVAFAVGLLTRAGGPLLATVALLGHLPPLPADLAPFSSWSTTTLVVTGCLIVALAPGRWSWDHLFAAPPARGRARHGLRRRDGSRAKAPTVSARRPEHAPPLLYPVGQAAFRRPSEL